MPTESNFLETAKHQYVIGALDLLEYEQAVEHVLKGGTLTAGGRISVEVEVRKHEIPFPMSQCPKMETVDANAD